MKKIFVACAVAITATAMASALQHQKKSAPLVLSQQYYEDTPRPKKDTMRRGYPDTSRNPWPDTTRRPTPPRN